MNDACASAGTAQAGADLHETSWVPCYDPVSTRGCDVPELRREHRIRRLRFDEVVDPRRAAALLRVRQREQGEVWNRAQHGERWSYHALCMQQVTRRVVRDAKRERCAGLRAGGGQKLADVANALG